MVDTSTKIESILIVGKRWFQRTYGNTYHSATIYINGECIGDTGKHYGYGEQFLYTAFEHLAELGFIQDWRENRKNGSPDAPWYYCQQRGIKYSYQSVDVSIEKDL